MGTFFIFINTIFITIHVIITVGNIFPIFNQMYRILADYT